VRNSGYLDQRERDEKTHEVVVKLLMGKLFTGFDERFSGPMDLRFKKSVGNAVRNIIELGRESVLRFVLVVCGAIWLLSALSMPMQTVSS
jgi:hypothetical protein